MKAKYFQIGLMVCLIGMAKAVTISDGVKLGTTNTVPVGSNSIAAGDSNNANNFSLAFGYGNIADNYSLAVGDQNVASWGSVSIGGGNIIDASSYYSMAIGEYNNSGYNGATFLIGAYNTMGLQWGSAAIGNSNTLQTVFGKTGSGNILIDQLNRIDQSVSSAPTSLQGTVLIGADNQSSSTMAFAFGKGNIAQTDTVTVGTYAQTVSGASLIVGNSTAGNARSNGLVVLRNGEVQIAGSLVVGGNPTMTQGTASSYLQGQGFVNTSYLSTNGYLKKATGINASVGANGFLAIGNSAHATGSSSMAIGDGASAVASGTISLGGDSVASAPYAFALQGGQAEGEYSFAASYGVASGKCSLGLAAGWAYTDSAVAIGGFDEAAGWANEAGGVGSVAIGGATNSAWGDYSYALGCNSFTVGKHSYSIGYGTRTNAY